MTTPPYLKSGDKIAIVAPARKVKVSEMEPAISIFRGWGLQIVTGPHLFGEYHQFSGSDEDRAADLQMMLDDTEIKAIVCARGGYGTVKIIDNLNFTKFEQNPKWIVGFSDITVLHSHIQSMFGIETIHAAMPVNFAESGTDDQSLESLRQALFGELKPYRLPVHPLNISGSASGLLVGGNLSILYSLIGSPSDIDTNGKILFLEDVDEYLYHLDRMMMNLKRTGKLSGIKGLIVGGLADMKDNAIPYGKSGEEIIFSYAKELDIPVCFGFPAGHIPDNRSLFMGREAELVVGESGSVLGFIDSGKQVLKGMLLKRLLKPSLFILGFFLFIYFILHLVRNFFG